MPVAVTRRLVSRFCETAAMVAFLVPWVETPAARVARQPASVATAPAPSTTRHRGTFHGQAVDDVATVAATPVSVTTAEPTATLVTTS